MNSDFWRKLSCELAAKVRCDRSRIRELEAKLADTGQMYRDAFKRVRALEAALRKMDEWFYPGDSDLPHEVALMNEVHGLVTAETEVNK